MKLKHLLLVLAVFFILSGCGTETEYSGDTLNGLPHGKGTWVHKNGATYSGEFVQGRREGYGTWQHQSGITYRGSWENNLYHGYGTLFGPGEQLYEGEWSEGLRHGFGVQVWLDGRRYEGYWEDDLMHGRGTLTHPDGSVFEGIWVEGSKAGEGVLTSADGEVFTGTWEDDQCLHVPVELIALSSESVTLTLDGYTYQLDAIIVPGDATNPVITWETSDPEVVLVEEGAITPMASGTATVYASAEDNNVTAQCRVTVLPSSVPVSNLQLNQGMLTLFTDGDPENLQAIISPANATNRTVYWSSSNPEVATVSASGRVTPRQPGSTEITARSDDGGFVAICTVIVRDPIGLGIFGNDQIVD